MNSVKILTARTWNDYFPLQVVYEWEDIISQTCNYSLDLDSTQKMDKEFNKPLNNAVQRIIRNSFLGNYVDNTFNYLTRKNHQQHYLTFILYPSPIQNHYAYSAACIPILCDCFSDVIDKVPEYFNKSKLLFVTNIEVYNYLKNTSMANRINYQPLSISDQYLRNTIPLKSIDVLQVGRQNTVLHSWMLQLIKRFPEVEYVYNDEKLGGYYSNKKGFIGKIETRTEYMHFLASAKVSLLSSPGIDGGEKRTGGYNPVTPRFYESAINYCYMIGRFPDAPDFISNEVSSVCSRPSTYEEFETNVLANLSTPIAINEPYQKFIKAHLTSTIAGRIKKEVDKL